MKKILSIFLLPSLLFVLGCSGKRERNHLVVQASSTPHAEILEVVREQMLQEGIEMEIVVIDDYQIPNRALAEGEIDANFFQHVPFLEEQIRQFGYEIVPLAAVHFEPMSLYGSFDTIRSGGVVAIPGDPTNEARALALLAREGIITLKETERFPTIRDIVDNPYRCTFRELDAALLPRVAKETAGAVIPTNYALAGGLSPLKDSIAREVTTPYLNVVVIRQGDAEEERFLLFKRCLQSDAVREYIQTRYEGAILPAF